MRSHRHWGNWRSDALDPEGQCRTVWVQSRTSGRQWVGSPDSQKRCERGLRLGPGVQTEIRDPVVLETCEGPGYREAERPNHQESPESIGPQPCQNRERFPMCLCTGLANYGWTGGQEERSAVSWEGGNGQIPSPRPPVTQTARGPTLDVIPHPGEGLVHRAGFQHRVHRPGVLCSPGWRWGSH